MSKHHLFSYLFYSLITLTAISCNIFQKEPSLELIPSDELQAFLWEDDLNFVALEKTIQQSILYYQKLPESHLFQYGNLFYTPQEMIASHHLFLNILEHYQGVEFSQQLQEKFLVFESKNKNEEAFFTGYYNPILPGSIQPTPEYPTPLFGKPDDLIHVDLGLFKKSWKGKRIFGKIENQEFVPYDSRDHIVYQKTLEKRYEPLMYIQDDIELFFLQIQGSGLIQLEDGTLKRMNYIAQNGHPYRAIGNLLLAEKKIPLEEMSMQSIKKYLYDHPKEVRRILNYNPSYTFFLEIEEGPLGNIEVPLTPERTIAMDRHLIPKGGLTYIETSRSVFQGEEKIGTQTIKRFTAVQDTGGAIRGHGRADIFWGNGARAEHIAGHMQDTGRIFLIVGKKEFLNTAEPYAYPQS